MRFLICALSLVLSTTAVAADIGWQADRMAAGSVMVMADSAGAITHVKRDTQGGAHLFDTFAGQGGDATFIGSYTTNARGDVTAIVAADGAVTRFAPHRCNRTIGECRYAIIHSDGFQEQRRRVTETTRDGLRYREYGTNGLVIEGAMTLDDMGIAKKSWKKQRGQGGRVRSRRVMIALR